MDLVKFNYADVKGVNLEKKGEVKKRVIELFKEEGRMLERVDYVFCSDEYLLSINRAFLKHDFYTDIITFDLSIATSVIGEIYISVERVLENAKMQRVPLRKEMLRVIFHGALHLCGYRDKKKSEITLMRQKEDYYLRSYS